MTEGRARIAVFRPADGRIETAVEYLEERGATAIADPMLAVEPTGDRPREDADFVVFTSKTGAELLAAGWAAGETTVCAIGESTATALEAQGIDVDIVPETYSSAGLVGALEDRVDGARVEVARSDHGSEVLLDGLESAGAYVHETILYQLVRPETAGESVEMAADGNLDGALFTSSLTVEHVLEIAEERGQRDAVLAGLAGAVVGAIGEPTRETAIEHGIEVDVVPETAAFAALADAVLEQC